MLAICLALLDQEADRRLFLETYEANKRRVYHVAYGVLQDQHLAEDVVQDVFLRRKSSQKFHKKTVTNSMPGAS